MTFVPASPLRPLLAAGALALALLVGGLVAPPPSDASSHREAPQVADDPLVDNTDVYAFRSPDAPGTVTIIANYIPLSHPDGGPNYTHFGENIRYEVHIKNQTSTGPLGSATDDITYRFTFRRVNEDPTTFFNIRLGKENLNTFYTLEKSTNGGRSFTTVITDGPTPPYNIGPRSIESPVGLNANYQTLVDRATMTLPTFERVFVGPRDDPFFVDLGGVFDLGNIRQRFGTDNTPGEHQNPALARDAVAGYNTHTIALQIPIQLLQKDGLQVGQADNILDRDFVIGVWASASRRQIRTLSTNPRNPQPTESGDFVQVSRLGMPLTNEVIIPIGMKDYWNYTKPYDAAEQEFAQYFANPELGLYMGNGQFGAAVPGLSEDLKIQQNSLPALNLDGDNTPGESNDGLNFTNGKDGAFALFPLVANGTISLAGTAFEVPTRPTARPDIPTALIGPGQPRRLDILPIFYFGVPNLPPYQLAIGKELDPSAGKFGPLDKGKPFVETFLPITNVPGDGLYGGDMLRLNMATPTTDRSSSNFTNLGRLGLVGAAAAGLTTAPFNDPARQDVIEFIPNMDGFPNGRRLEDDVTTIELQAVAGLVLAAVGVPEDDFSGTNYNNLLTAQLLSELTFLSGPTKNDLPILRTFPYAPNPHRGFDYVRDQTPGPPAFNFNTSSGIGVGVPAAFFLGQSAPNPARAQSAIEFQVARTADVRLDVYDVQGRLVETLVDGQLQAGTHTADWNTSRLASGTYVYRLMVDGEFVGAKQATVIR